MKRKRRKERLTQEELGVQWLCEKYPHISREDLDSCYGKAFTKYQHIRPIAHFASILALLDVLKLYGS